ncbi:MAG: hypothetical protein Q9181_007880 [Wetmoreana brouardii]
MRAICKYGQISAQDFLEPYKRYFPVRDEEDDFQTHVGDVLGLIAGTGDTDGAIGAIVGTFVVDNLDFGANDPDAAAHCSDENTLAYTDTDQLDGREKIHFCDPLWTRRMAADVDCDSLDPYPSSLMDSFSRIALHEMTHYSSVGPETSLGLQIRDPTMADGWPTDDPETAHALLDENPMVTETNADSYAWMSLDAWFSHRCAQDPIGNEWQSFFTQDPPPYEPAE